MSFYELKIYEKDEVAEVYEHITQGEIYSCIRSAMKRFRELVPRKKEQPRRYLNELTGRCGLTYYPLFKIVLEECGEELRCGYCEDIRR